VRAIIWRRKDEGFDAAAGNIRRQFKIGLHLILLTMVRKSELLLARTAAGPRVVAQPVVEPDAAARVDGGRCVEQRRDPVADVRLEPADGTQAKLHGPREVAVVDVLAERAARHAGVLLDLRAAQDRRLVLDLLNASERRMRRRLAAQAHRRPRRTMRSHGAHGAHDDRCPAQPGWPPGLRERAAAGCSRSSDFTPAESTRLMPVSASPSPRPRAPKPASNGRTQAGASDAPK